ncbi:MAG: hypothetical protein Q3975_02125 [Oscillospiraceae bacterium]|nr:hypothetical protein [Oscillospiraceae bacterium]
MSAIKNKIEINLITTGTGLMFFGLWTFIKFFLTIVFLGVEYDDNTSDEVKLIATIITIIAVAIVSALFCYVGLSARAEGKGKKKSVVYLIVNGFILFFHILIIILEAAALLFGENILTIIITMIIDATAAVFMLEVMINSIKLRKIRRHKRIMEVGYEL